MNYPKRGCMSDDTLYYTHFDGSVHKREKRQRGEACGDKPCSLYMLDGDCPRNLNSEAPCRYSLLAGAYVLSDEEQAACDMARAMIRMCGYFRGLAIPAQSRQSCGRCSDLSNKSCPARVYLAAHHQPDAWEVKP